MSYSSLPVSERKKLFENKSKVEPKIIPLNDKKERQVRDFVTMVLRQDSDLDDPNKVYMSEKSLKKLYPSWTQKSTDPKYVSIAGYIFKVKAAKCEDNDIYISPGHVSYCAKDLLKSHLPVHKVNKPMRDVSAIKKIKIGIKLEKLLEETLNKDKQIEFRKKDLASFIVTKFSDEYFSNEKTYFFENNMGIFSFVVTGIDFDIRNGETSLGLPGKLYQNYGRITKYTEFKIETKAANKIKIMEETAKKEWIKQLTFNVEAKGSLSLHRPKEYMTPFIMDVNDAKKYLEKNFTTYGKEKEISLGTSRGIYNKDLPCSFTFIKATVDSDKFKDQIGPVITRNNHNNRNFEFDSNKVFFEYPEHKIIMTNRKKGILTADEIELELEDINGSVYSSKHCFISVKDLTEKLLTCDKELACGQKFSIRIDGKEYKFSVSSLHSIKEGVFTDSVPNKVVSPWKVHPKTKFKIKNVIHSESFELVKDMSVQNLSKIRFKLVLDDTKVSDDPILIKEDVIKKALTEFDDYFDSKVVVGNYITISEKNYSYTLTIEEMVNNKGQLFRTSNEGLPKIGKLSDKVNFEFEVDGGVRLLNKSDNRSMKMNCIERLRQSGIGGLTKQMEEITIQIVMKRGKLRKFCERLGVQPAKGLLLYGPPGTGKTLLAENLGKLLNVSKDNINIISASELLNKWVGGTEKKLRKLFDAAKKDWEKYKSNPKEEPPLHLIGIDEIDAIAGKRSGDKKGWEISQVNQLLALMDGAGKMGRIGNILVVGITNHRDRLDDPFLRPGRFDLQLEVKEPDVKGREEIFDIYLKKPKRIGIIGSDNKAKTEKTSETGKEKETETTSKNDNKEKLSDKERSDVIKKEISGLEKNKLLPNVKKKGKKKFRPITSEDLAKMTNKFTGAEIKDVVSRSVGFMLERLYSIVSVDDDVDTNFAEKYPDVCRLKLADYSWLV